MEKEIFKDIKGYEGYYKISNMGKVVRFYKKAKNKILKHGARYSNYRSVVLCVNNKRKTKNIHRLVAEAFIPNPENKKTVNHIDGNKSNNCVYNLEWCTQSENIKHAFRLGLSKPSNNQKQSAVNSNRKLTYKQAKKIRELYRKNNLPYYKLAKMFGVHKTTIRNIIKFESYKIDNFIK